MVKLTAPCMSLGASGTLANSIVFSNWKGRAYARSHVIPSNPKSALQVSMRAMMKFISQAWAGVGSTPQGTWDDLAAAGTYSPFNAFVSKNQMRWREMNAPSQTYPAAETGTPAVATLDSAVGGERHIDVTFTITTLNDVWGVILYRSPTGTFTPSIANAIVVLPVDGTGTLVYTDSNLAAGEYFYDATFFSKEGLLDAEEGEVSGTAT